MDNYKYFENAKENAYMTDTPCQFCGTTENCLDGVFIEGDEDYESVCLNCYDAKKAPSKIPPFVAEKVNNDPQKIKDLSDCPPVPWIQSNEWPVCCGDFGVFIGEWSNTDFDNNSEDGNGFGFLQVILADDQKPRVESFENLWNDISFEAAAFVFRCPHCGKLTAVCQYY